MPFPGEKLNGGKVRQAINLIYQNLDLIRSEYKSTVATACGKDSPQGLIISRVAKAYNLGCFVGYGALSPKTLEENKFIQHIRQNNGIAERIANYSYDNVISSSLKKLQEENGGKNFLIVKFGIDFEKNPVVVDCIADQVKNLPDKLDNLIIPTGSGITAGSILRGIKKYGKKIKKIHVVHISGEDRRKKIKGIEGDVPYIYVKDTTYPYSKEVKKNVIDCFVLDKIY